jgi:hypothetical protein
MNYSDSSYKSINSGSDITVGGVTGKFGLQYEQKVAEAEAEKKQIIKGLCLSLLRSGIH